MPDWLHILIRAFSALAALFVLTRILGKKQISELTFFQYVTGITLGDLAGDLSTNVEKNFFHGFLALMVWFLIPFLLEMLTLKSKMLRYWFEGKGTVLIKDGRILEDNLKKERFTGDELLEQLRSKSVFRVSDVEFAMLEPSGDLSILLKKEHQPLTANHLGIQLNNEKPSQTAIMDGVIQDEPLAAAGKSRGWLLCELEKLGMTKENVFLAQVDAYGELSVDLYDDKLKVPKPVQRRILLATLKKCEADLEIFALTTRQADAKLMYGKCAEELQQHLLKLTPILKSK
ncbi:DUF421 domain-containing protein [Paenibacillus eucommiae]|uniref:Uncharacterized membrane protein YcaP (DUF421 family) n=1 Tax=Paenibacillus eucommiae TaxID=1355755 RepID=A0ABS4J8Q2_9BACL|nr:DUF421 domain-containing protein [Paenibacillus eucommiae]MBP1995641.1 uncharacterized membrane protein YcaP (DUF421 family) [Paenibacillus eucommiae]